MAEKMTIEMIAQQQGVLKTLDGFVKTLNKMDDKLDRVEKTSRRGARTAEAGWQKVGRQIKGAATELIGFQSLAGTITAGIRAITAEFEKIERIGKQASEQAGSTGASLRRLTANFSPDASVRSSEELAQRIQGISERTRTPINVVSGAAETALSARGAADVATALDSVEQALRAFPGEGEIANELASRSLDLAKQAGTSDTRIALGALTQTQQAARVTDLAKLGASAPTATLSTKNAGGTVEEGLELFATITNLAADAEGRRSATAQVALEQRLKSFRLEGEEGDAGTGFITSKNRVGDVVQVPREDYERLLAAQTGRERLSVLQSSPELAQSFLGELPEFEKRVDSALEALVSGAPEALAELRSAEQKIQPLNQAQVNNFEKFINTLNNLPFQEDLEARQQSQANIEEFQLDPTTSRLGRVENILKETREQVNLPGPDIATAPLFQALTRLDRFFGTSPEAAGIRQLENIRDDLGGRSPEETELINKQIQLLERILEENQKQNTNRAGQRPNQPAAALNGRQ